MSEAKKTMSVEEFLAIAKDAETRAGVLSVGSVVLVERKESGSQFLAGVVKIGRDGGPYLSWIRQQGKVPMLNKPTRVDGDKLRIVRKASTDESIEFIKRLHAIAREIAGG